jgi:signal peptidase I
VTAKSEGELEEVIEPAWLHPFAQYRFRIGDTWYRVRTSLDHFLQRAGVETERVYRPGETVLRFSFTHGDYILVDRFTYNFRRPRRGEIVVFETRDIEELPSDQYYVKRLVALGSDRVRIGNDRHLVINDQRLDETTPGFEALYTSRDDRVPTAYAGHINATVAAWIGLRRPERLARLFPDEETVYEVRPKHALVMGDNALFSLDSRVWGDLPYRNLMGRAWYVYWPLSERVGRCGP